MPHRSVRSSERGVVAAVMLVFIVVGILMFVGVARTAYMRQAMAQVISSADGVALTCANWMMTNPNPDGGDGGIHGPTPIDLTAIASTSNACTGCTISTKRADWKVQASRVNHGFVPLSYDAHVIRSNEAVALTTLWRATNILPLVVGSMADPNKNLEASSHVRVPQVLLNKFTILPQPLILAIDYSGAMALPLEKEGAQGNTRSAISRINDVVRDLTSDVGGGSTNLGFADVFNFGLIRFTDRVLDIIAPVQTKEPLDELPLDSAQDRNKQAGDIKNRLQDVVSRSESNTDIGLALRTATEVLMKTSPDPGQAFAPRPAIMLVTDGQPNTTNGSRSISGAQSSAQNMASQAWQSNPRQAGTSNGIDTYTAIINRYTLGSGGDEMSDSETNDFARSISGGMRNKYPTPDPSHVFKVEDTGDLTDTLTQLNVITHCASSPIDDRLQQKGPESTVSPQPIPVPIGLYPRADDIISGVLVIDVNNQRQEIFVERAQSWQDFVSSDLSGAPIAFNAQTLALNHKKDFRFYYDEGTRRVFLNTFVCNIIANLTARAGLTGTTYYQFRMRWTPAYFATDPDDY